MESSVVLALWSFVQGGCLSDVTPLKCNILLTLCFCHIFPSVVTDPQAQPRSHLVCQWTVEDNVIHQTKW